MPKAFANPSPGFLPWVNVLCECANSERVRHSSVPNIALGIFDLVVLQKFAIFIFKSHSLVVALLIVYVAAYALKV
jgi:hypothetical protein